MGRYGPGSDVGAERIIQFTYARDIQTRAVLPQFREGLDKIFGKELLGVLVMFCVIRYPISR